MYYLSLELPGLLNKVTLYGNREGIQMKPVPEQAIRNILNDFAPDEVEAVVSLVKKIRQKHALETGAGEIQLSDAENARICAVLDSVAALSMETGPAVSNRDHDKYLYDR
jgi:hypothetical protein